MGRVNWSDFKSVVAYARSLGPGLVVFQWPGRSTYAIGHASRFDTERERYAGCREWDRT